MCLIGHLKVIWCFLLICLCPAIVLMHNLSRWSLVLLSFLLVHTFYITLALFLSLYFKYIYLLQWSFLVLYFFEAVNITESCQVFFILFISLYNVTVAHKFPVYYWVIDLEKYDSLIAMNYSIATVRLIEKLWICNNKESLDASVLGFLWVRRGKCKLNYISFLNLKLLQLWLWWTASQVLY